MSELKLANACPAKRRGWSLLIAMGAFGALIVPQTMICTAQTERQAIIPIAQGGGSPAGSLTGPSASNNGGISDGPISAGEIVHVNVFDAPDFSTVTRVSESGDIAIPIAGVIHIDGLSSSEAEELITKKLKDKDLILEPQVLVTVDATRTGITILGEVHSPGIIAPTGKHLLSDVIAAAGGLTGNTGRVIEISSDKSPEQRDYIPWDPTMHNTASYDREVRAGDRVIVRACGIAYIGGNVSKPGAYSLCGSQQAALTQLIALAGGVQPLSSAGNTVIIRNHPDGTRSVLQVDVHKILLSKAADIVVHEDDVIYIPKSGVKAAAQQAMAFSLSLVAPLLYLYR